MIGFVFVLFNVQTTDYLVILLSKASCVVNVDDIVISFTCAVSSIFYLTWKLYWITVSLRMNIVK